jgi:hypothetical protein
VSVAVTVAVLVVVPVLVPVGKPVLVAVDVVVPVEVGTVDVPVAVEVATDVSIGTVPVAVLVVVPTVVPGPVAVGFPGVIFEKASPPPTGFEVQRDSSLSEAPQPVRSTSAGIQYFIAASSRVKKPPASNVSHATSKAPGKFFASKIELPNRLTSGVERGYPKRQSRAA